MQYVYVEPDISAKDNKAPQKINQEINYSPVNVSLTGNCLISLIHAFEKKNFGLHSLPQTQQKIDDYKKIAFSLSKSAELYIDSGGYSYIKGTIDPRDTAKMITCYAEYLYHCHTEFDYIFSLDIPFNTNEKNKEYNDKYFLERMNYKSINKSVNILKNNPDLCRKFYFVHQFKIKEQYDIWSKIYNDPEIGLNNLPINRAIGGLVKIRNINKINITASVGIAFKCLYDYLNSNATKEDRNNFKLHILGINLPIDRFTNIILEKLFSAYLKNEGLPEAKFTYDTINYSTDVFQSPRHRDVMVYNQSTLQRYTNTFLLPNEIIDTIYKENIYIENIKKNLDMIKSGFKPESTRSIVPINIFSNLELDRFFDNLVTQDELIDNLLDQNVNSEEMAVQYPYNLQNRYFSQYFNQKFYSSLKKNLLDICTFNDWFLNDRSDKTLENLMRQYIKSLKSPEKIES